MACVDSDLSLARDIKRACQLLEKLQKSKYCGEVPATKLAALQKVAEFVHNILVYKSTVQCGKVLRIYAERCQKSAKFV